MKLFKNVYISIFLIILVVISSCSADSYINQSESSKAQATISQSTLITELPQPTPTPNPLPEGFADVKDYVPDAIIDLRYAGSENFTGRPVPGYEANRAILTTKACIALKEAADKLRNQGYKIYIYDAYRPSDAVKYFVTWGKDSSDTIKKEDYYPDLEKEDLFKMYISSDSNHSRGSTIDLSIVKSDGTEVDMGGHFDFFGEISHTFSTQISATQLTNRKILRKAMEDAGFTASNTEWWHFKLTNQPYTEAFNFYVK